MFQDSLKLKCAHFLCVSFSSETVSPKLSEGFECLCCLDFIFSYYFPEFLLNSDSVLHLHATALSTNPLSVIQFVQTVTSELDFLWMGLSCLSLQLWHSCWLWGPYCICAKLVIWNCTWQLHTLWHQVEVRVTFEFFNRLCWGDEAQKEYFDFHWKGTERENDIVSNGKDGILLSAAVLLSQFNW